MISGITWTHIKSVWNHSGPLEVPYFANQNWSGTFFAVSHSKPAVFEVTNLTKSTSFFRYWVNVTKNRRFRQILWPSQNILTLSEWEIVRPNIKGDFSTGIWTSKTLMSKIIERGKLWRTYLVSTSNINLLKVC